MSWWPSRNARQLESGVSLPSSARDAGLERQSKAKAAATPGPGSPRPPRVFLEDHLRLLGRAPAERHPAALLSLHAAPARGTCTAIFAAAGAGNAISLCESPEGEQSSAAGRETAGLGALSAGLPAPLWPATSPNPCVLRGGTRSSAFTGARLPANPLHQKPQAPRCPGPHQLSWTAEGHSALLLGWLHRRCPPASCAPRGTPKRRHTHKWSHESDGNFPFLPDGRVRRPWSLPPRPLLGFPAWSPSHELPGRAGGGPKSGAA